MVHGARSGHTVIRGVTRQTRLTRSLADFNPQVDLSRLALWAEPAARLCVALLSRRKAALLFPNRGKELPVCLGPGASRWVWGEGRGGDRVTAENWNV